MYPYSADDDERKIDDENNAEGLHGLKFSSVRLKCTMGSIYVYLRLDTARTFHDFQRRSQLKIVRHVNVRRVFYFYETEYQQRLARVSEIMKM